MATRGSGDLAGRIKPIGGGPHNAPMRSIPHEPCAVQGGPSRQVASERRDDVPDRDPAVRAWSFDRLG